MSKRFVIRDAADLPSPARTAQPARSASLEADVLVPVWQSVVTGAIMSILMAAGLASAGADTVDAIEVSVVSGMVVAAAAWLYLLRDTRRTLWHIEEFLRADIDGDGVVGQPAPETVRVEVASTNTEGYQALVYADLPGTLSQLRTFACGVLSGRGLAEAAWIGRNGIYSRGQYAQLREELLRRGWVEWRNVNAPAQGLDLTESGEAVFEQICQD